METRIYYGKKHNDDLYSFYEVHNCGRIVGIYATEEKARMAAAHWERLFNKMKLFHSFVISKTTYVHGMEHSEILIR